MRYFLGIFFGLWILSSPLWAAYPKRVAVVPFKVNASQDLAYVREGIQDMLTTRLFAPGQVETVDPALVKKTLAKLGKPFTLEKARALGEKLGVDYVLFGSVSVFGENVSVDAELLPIKEARSPITLYTEVKGLGEVIPTLAEFAKRSRDYILGKAAPEEAVAVTAPPPSTPVSSAPPTPPSPQPVSPARMHPDKLVALSPPPAVPATSYPSSGTPSYPSSGASSASSASQRSGVPPTTYADVDQWPDYPPENLPPTAPSAAPRPPANPPQGVVQT
ncbi:MAG: hypothetical protein DSZ24_07205, partial [Thermodesulfatator sp.]